MISERLKLEYPLDMAKRISHEAIYHFIYVMSRGELKRTLIHALRQEYSYRRKRRTGYSVESRGKIAEMFAPRREVSGGCRPDSPWTLGKSFDPR